MSSAPATTPVLCAAAVPADGSGGGAQPKPKPKPGAVESPSAPWGGTPDKAGRAQAWGAAGAPRAATPSPVAKTSFSDILSEELAVKFELEETSAASATLASEFQAEDAAARSLRRHDAGAAPASESDARAALEVAALETRAPSEELSQDLALAMQLQEEELALLDADHRFFRSQPQGRVAVVSRFSAATATAATAGGRSSGSRRSPESARRAGSAAAEKRDEDGSEEASSADEPGSGALGGVDAAESPGSWDDEREDEDDEEEEDNRPELGDDLPPPPPKAPPSASLGAASSSATPPSSATRTEPAATTTRPRRLPPWPVRDKTLKGQGGDRDIVTKHDPVLNGMRNARRLERSLDRCGALGHTLVPNTTYNSLQHRVRRQGHQEKGVTGRTVERETFQTRAKGLDMRTSLILHRMLDSGLLDEVVCVVKTGKEAVVYLAVGPAEAPASASGTAPLPASSSPPRAGPVRDPALAPAQRTAAATGAAQRNYAVKVFKTTLSEFRNRHEYIEGDFRFQDLGQVSKANAHKIVQVWAEKELKNMTRMFRAGLPVPEPVRLDDNVLVMGFIGEDGWGAPTLAEFDLASCKPARAHAVFVQVAAALRSMFARCNLVHADLSEYNVLVAEGGKRCVVVDVGQAVERGHPRAMEFLERDVRNVLRFFWGKRVGPAPTAANVAAVVGWVVDGVVVPDDALSREQREWTDAFAAEGELPAWMDREFVRALATLVGGEGSVWSTEREHWC